MTDRQRLFVLFVVMVCVAAAASGIAISFLYQAAFEAQERRLAVTTKSNARFMEAVARFDARESVDFPGGARGATLSQILDAYGNFKGFGETGEFILGEMSGENIVFILPAGRGLNNPNVVGNEGTAEPMRRALLGQSGVMIGRDYIGVWVLAAYEPVVGLGLGIVAKINLSEIRMPFIRAGLATILATMLVVLVGAAFFYRLSAPISKHIIESREAEKRALQQLNSAIENLPAAFFLFDSEERIVLVNKMSHVMFPELSAKGIFETGSSFERMVRTYTAIQVKGAAGDQDNWVRERLEEFRGKQNNSREMELKDGRWLQIIDRKTPENWTISIRIDITDRKLAESAIAESEKKFHELFEFASDSIFIVEPATGRFLEVNENAAKRLGYSREELLGMTFHQLNKPESAARNKKVIQRLMEKGSVMVESIHIRKDGGEIPVEISSQVVELKGKTVFQSFVRDISDRKRLEAELHQQRKMEAIGNLASGIAHDFNNILMGIQLNISMMERDLDEASSLKQQFLSIREYIESGSNLTGQLLGFVRSGVIELSPADPNKLIQETAAMFGRAQRDVSFREDLHPAPHSIKVNQGQLQQVLLNLFINARQAMTENRELILRSENVTLEDDEVESHGLQGGDFVAISVTDMGKGIEPEILPRIFEPFFTTKSGKEGSGLGLATAYNIVKNHGGIISASSEIGRGTTFQIFLPAFEETIVNPSEEPDKSTGGTGTILVVDDDVLLTETNAILFATLGYSILTANTGEEAVRTFRDSGKIDLVVLDLTMPGMSGREVFDKIRELDPEAKVLLSTGYNIDGEGEEMMALGCCGYIQKPYTLEKISVKFRELI